MAIDNIREIRSKKLKKIRITGVNPYPRETKRTHTISEALLNFNELQKAKKRIVLVGRIKAVREHGGSAFLNFEDGSASSLLGSTGKIQAYLRKNKLGPKGYAFFKDFFDIGDFIEIRGILFKTKRGEKTIEADGYNILAKSLLPLPEKWHGLKDIEERYRKRYLDLIFNPEVKEKFKTRSKIIKELRSFLDEEGFLEVETPVLQPIYGGTKAKPFKTHLNALKMDLYLRIAPELYLKRLLVGGFEKIYEIGRVFRNEGMDRFHNPEYTHFEFYWAYADDKDLMKLIEKMLSALVKRLFKKTEIEYQGEKINFKGPWPRVEFAQLIKKYTKLDIDEVDKGVLAKKAKELGITLEKGVGKAEIADEIYKKVCRSKILQPTFIIHHPVGSFPLAKAFEKNPAKLANFQIVVAGWELGLGFSELNDSLEQRRRFKEQEKSFKSGFEEAQRMDKDFLEALEYGMPPAAGFGMGIDRLAALLTDSHSLREIILFPTMRKKNSSEK